MVNSKRARSERAPFHLMLHLMPLDAIVSAAPMRLLPEYLRCFTEALSPASAAAMADVELQRALLAVLHRTSARWPQLALEATDFLPYLAQRLVFDDSLTAALASTHVEDLYLACACERRLDGAIASFDAEYQTIMKMALSRMQNIGDIEDEVRQRVHQRLFVASGNTPARIASYQGRGPLKAWVRATTIREAIAIFRESKPNLSAPEDVLSALPDLADDPEMHYLKGLYRQSFKSAFEASFAMLSARDRTLLRYKYCDNTSLDDLGLLYRVHRATVARWLVTIRETLLTDTRARMLDELGTSNSELDSIMRVIQSQLDASIAGRLQSSH